jgi:RNA polymerase sigma-70 factor (ECF subfamily)
MIATLMPAPFEVPPPPPSSSPKVGEVSFERATAELRPLVRAVVASMVGARRDDPDVEDCTSETLRRALEGRARLRDGEPMRPWVTGIAKHIALDALRARKRDRMRAAPRNDDGAPPSTDAVERVPDAAPTPFDHLATAERDHVIRRALDRLPEGQRRALRMFHMEGLAYQEIAQRLGVPLGTVATWVTRARKAVAETIRQETEES